MAVAIYSALTGIPVDNNVAMTGEISIRGQIKPVGGVAAKIEAAQAAGAKKVIIPADNWQEIWAQRSGIQVLPAETLEQVFDHVLVSNGCLLSEKEIANLRPAAMN